MSAEYDDKTSETIELTQQTLELAVAAGGILRAIGRDDRAGQVVALLLDGHRSGTAITAIELMGALGLMSLEQLPQSEPVTNETVIVSQPIEGIAAAPALLSGDEIAHIGPEPAFAEPLPPAEEPIEAEEPAEVELSEGEVTAQDQTVDFLKKAYPAETVEQLSLEQLVAFRQNFEYIVIKNRQQLGISNVGQRHLDVAVLRAKSWMNGATTEEIINQAELNIKNYPALYASNMSLAGRVGRAFTLEMMLQPEETPEPAEPSEPDEPQRHQAESVLPDNFKQHVLDLLQHSPPGPVHVTSIIRSIFNSSRVPGDQFRQIIRALSDMVDSGELVSPEQSLFELGSQASNELEQTPGFRRHTPRQSQEDLGKMIRGAGITPGVKLSRRQRPGVGPDQRR